MKLAQRFGKILIIAGLSIAVALLVTACGAELSPASTELTLSPSDPLTTAPTDQPAESLSHDLPGENGPAGRAQPALPQSIRVQRISVEQGLSESSVYCIFQDSRGFLWFCTQDGLNKYDGHGFHVHRPDPGRNSLAFNYVTSVCESPEGVLWIATLGGGLDRLDLETERFTHFPYRPDKPSPSSDWLTSLFCDQDGRLFFGTTAAGLNQYDPAKNQFILYRHHEENPATLSHDSVNAIYRDREGALWVGTDGGLDRGDPVGQRFVHYRHDPNHPNSLGGTAVQAIYEDRRGVLWIGTDGGLDRFDRQAEQFVHYQHDPEDAQGIRGSLSHNSVQSIFEDREGVLWIGTDDGLNIFDREQERFIRYQHDPSDPSSLSHNWIWSIYEDREGVLWFGTYGGGLNKYDRSSERFAHYRVISGDPNSLSSNQIWSIYEDRAGMLWIGTAGAGLDRFDRAQGLVTHYQHDPTDPNSLSHNVVRAILEDRQGMLWIGTDGGGLDKFDPQAERFTHYQHDPADPYSLSHNAVRAILEDREGALWIATDGGGLNRFYRETERFVRYPIEPGSLRGGSMWSLAQDREGMLWVGTAGGGLYRLNRDTRQFTSYYHDPSDIMLSIHEDHDGYLWIATFGNGLYRFDREAEAFSVYRMKDGLPSDAVYGILEDDEGFLWLSTNNGISRFDPQSGTFKSYDVSDGLQSREFRTGAYHKSHSGEIFFGGVNGFNAFYPERIGADNRYVPPVVLTSLTQGGEPLVPGLAAESVREFTLEWPNNFFEFEFAALSYSRPEKNQLAYLLDGFDKDWIYVGTRRFGRYTNLPGGTYTLRIKGANGEGVWNEEGAAIHVTVVPPFWQTWTFRVIILVVLVASALGVFRQRVKSIEARSRKLEREVEERTQEIERRRRVAEGLRDILAVLNSDRPLDEVLEYIVAQAAELLGAGAALLHQLEHQKPVLTIQASFGLPDELAGISAIPFDASWADEAILTRQPYVILDLAQIAAKEDTAGDPLAGRWLALTRQRYRSFLAVPLLVEGEVDHCLALYYGEPWAYSDEEIDLAVALADQAALAIENARLYEQAQELAAVEERQRLARDLHDAVSQTLFSASLIAETLPDLRQIDPEEAEEMLDKLRQLSRGALAEMRTLLMELRPAALTEASLKELLRQLAQAVSGREGIPVAVAVDEPCQLPPQVHIALYRVAQEALNNVVKHAEASQVEVSLHCATLAPGPAPLALPGSKARVELTIRDDGCGFDPASVSAEHLGLGIMRERAEEVGASLEVESEVGQGTKVTVVWMDAGRRAKHE